MKEIQALNANMQLLQTRMVKLGSGASDEGSVKSKVTRCFFLLLQSSPVHFNGMLLWLLCAAKACMASPV